MGSAQPDARGCDGSKGTKDNSMSIDNRYATQQLSMCQCEQMWLTIPTWTVWKSRHLLDRQSAGFPRRHSDFIIDEGIEGISSFVYNNI